MREILFRGKRIDNGEWVYGDLIRHFENQRRFIAYDQLAYTYTVNGIYRLVTEHYCEVDLATVGQSTGVKGANDIEIFEGDICKDELDGLIGYIKYEPELLRWCFVCKYGQTSDLFHWFVSGKSPKVIGNIYENSDLLEATP